MRTKVVPYVAWCTPTGADAHVEGDIREEVMYHPWAHNRLPIWP